MGLDHFSDKSFDFWRLDSIGSEARGFQKARKIHVFGRLQLVGCQEVRSRPPAAPLFCLPPGWPDWCSATATPRLSRAAGPQALARSRLETGGWSSFCLGSFEPVFSGKPRDNHTFRVGFILYGGCPLQSLFNGKPKESQHVLFFGRGFLQKDIPNCARVGCGVPFFFYHNNRSTLNKKTTVKGVSMFRHAPLSVFFRVSVSLGVHSCVSVSFSVSVSPCLFVSVCVCMCLCLCVGACVCVCVCVCVYVCVCVCVCVSLGVSLCVCVCVFVRVSVCVSVWVCVCL